MVSAGEPWAQVQAQARRSQRKPVRMRQCPEAGWSCPEFFSFLSFPLPFPFYSFSFSCLYYLLLPSHCSIISSSFPMSHSLSFSWVPFPFSHIQSHTWPIFDIQFFLPLPVFLFLHVSLSQSLFLASGLSLSPPPHTTTRLLVWVPGACSRLHLPLPARCTRLQLMRFAWHVSQTPF